MEDKKSANCGYKLTYWKSEDEEKKEKAERLEAVIAAHQEELAKLCPPKPKPEPRELVELIRSKLVDVALACGGTDKMAEAFQHLKQAADRIEQLEAENKQLALDEDEAAFQLGTLKDTLKSYQRTSKLHIEFVKETTCIFDKLKAENKQLTAKIAELESLYSAATKALNSQIEKGE